VCFHPFRKICLILQLLGPIQGWQSESTTKSLFCQWQDMFSTTHMQYCQLWEFFCHWTSRVEQFECKLTSTTRDYGHFAYETLQLLHSLPASWTLQLLHSLPTVTVKPMTDERQNRGDKMGRFFVCHWLKNRHLVIRTAAVSIVIMQFLLYIV